MGRFSYVLPGHKVAGQDEPAKNTTFDAQVQQLSAQAQQLSFFH
jgi:hypothetical protein